MSERQRLADLYRTKTEEELQQIGEDASSLTDAAREALSAALAGRNLPPPPAARESTEVEFLDLVTIRQFRDLPEAILARGLLESAGIAAFLADENIVRMDWFISDLVGGVKLKVQREEVEAANLILQTLVPEESSQAEPD